MRTRMRIMQWLGVLSVAIATRAAAQATKVGLVPGWQETGSVWAPTPNILYSDLQIQYPTAMDLPVMSRIPDQNGSLNTSYPSLTDANTILIGHSNGGLVVRYASQQHSLLGTATIGTPNGGVPVLTNLDELAGYVATFGNDFLLTLNDFLAGDNHWLFDNYVIPAWEAYLDYENGLNYLLVSFFPSLTDPVLVEDYVGSAFLTDTLNASANVSTELSHATASASVVVVAQNYTYGGALRLLFTNGDATTWHDVIDGSAVGTLLVEDYILDNDYPLTDQNYQELNDLDILRELLWDWEVVYCAGVTAPHYTDPWILLCGDNDALLAVDYQARPGGAAIVPWTNVESHLFEPQQADLIEDLLKGPFHIPSR